MKGFDVPKEHSLQPHLQNEIEKYLPATPSSSFYSSKEECSLPRVWQEVEEKNLRLFPPANAEQDPGRGHFRAELNAAFQDTQISGHLFASPPFTPLLPLSSSVLFPSVNLCKLSLAFATFCFLLLTLLTILGGDKQLNNINNNLLGTLINEFIL